MSHTTDRQECDSQPHILVDAKDAALVDAGKDAFTEQQSASQIDTVPAKSVKLEIWSWFCPPVEDAMFPLQGSRKSINLNTLSGDSDQHPRASPIWLVTCY